jgi:hypothetical protein
MDTNVNNGNSGDDPDGTQTGTTDSNPDEVNDALRQLQATVSGFVQEAQASAESLIQQLRATDSTVQQNAALIERLSSWTANNRP